MMLDPDAPQKPRVALLGEFSAGKSTLANILLGVARSPVRVTATQAPPIWYVHGDGPPVRVTTEGEECPLDGDIDGVPLAETRAIRVPMSASLLERCDLLDMPGSSDPNMSLDAWDSLLPLADIVIWCTPATQAWRQSEAAIWDVLPTELKLRSLLLLTRIDKVARPEDRARLIRRVERETDGLFRAVLPVSLVQVGQSPADCRSSGMAKVIAGLDDILAHPIAQPPTPNNASDLEIENSPAVHGARCTIVPRRVAATGSRTIRRAGKSALI